MQKHLANTLSQAHLQGTLKPDTKANLTKEPALYPRFFDTPNFGGHRRCSDTPERRANVQQIALRTYGLTLVIDVNRSL